MPEGHKPICYDETALQSEPQKIQVVDLRSKLASVARQASIIAIDCMDPATY
ncbi:MAG: hypothetical protein Q8L78_08535 [Coxiellaceae bacterium]|nr:hypothetical protein [Coxiellaceae bacterium]